MNEPQEAHLRRLNKAFVSYNTQKYINGVNEHKTLLSEVDTLTLLYHARDEVLDQWNYIQTAIEAIEMPPKGAIGGGLNFL